VSVIAVPTLGLVSVLFVKVCTPSVVAKSLSPPSFILHPPAYAISVTYWFGDDTVYVEESPIVCPLAGVIVIAFALESVFFMVNSLFSSCAVLYKVIAIADTHEHSSTLSVGNAVYVGEVIFLNICKPPLT
jgi:hypothetical protein